MCKEEKKKQTARAWSGVMIKYDTGHHTIPHCEISTQSTQLSLLESPFTLEEKASSTHTEFEQDEEEEEVTCDVPSATVVSGCPMNTL